MSAATEFAPTVFIPERACPAGWSDPRPDADVIELFRPSAGSVAPPLRLTRRGVVVLAATTAVLALVLVWVAWLSAPSTRPATAGTAGTAATGAVSVVVADGDTLWSIAARVAPGVDPRAEVARLQRVNHLSGVGLHPGQVLRTS